MLRATYTRYILKFKQPAAFSRRRKLGLSKSGIRNNPKYTDWESVLYFGD